MLGRPGTSAASVLANEIDRAGPPSVPLSIPDPIRAMNLRRLSILALVLCVPLTPACRRAQDNQPPVATPSWRVNHPRAALGSPVDVTYRFQVASNAPAFDQDYRVMVHVLDGDDELMWTDDHLPSIPTRQWKAGQTVEYTRTVFVPIYPYIGAATVQMGLYSPKDGRRLPLAGEDSGQRAYKVGTLELLPQTENVFLIFKDGWHPAERASDNVEWQWTKKVATIAFRNPKKDVTFYLHADNPGTAFGETQTVEVAVNGQPADTVAVAPKQEVIHRTTLTAAQLGTGQMVEVRLAVDKTYVPALLPAANSRDPRELGVRVFHAFVEPRGK
jgi:hypothetical protein